MFKSNFSGRNKIWGFTEEIWGELPPNALPWLRAWAANEIKRKFQPLTFEWLDQRFPNIFEHDPNLSLVNSSWSKLWITYEKTMVVWMIFGS